MERERERVNLSTWLNDEYEKLIVHVEVPIHDFLVNSIHHWIHSYINDIRWRNETKRLTDCLERLPSNSDEEEDRNGWLLDGIKSVCWDNVSKRSCAVGNVAVFHRSMAAKANDSADRFDMWVEDSMRWWGIDDDWLNLTYSIAERTTSLR